MANMSYCRFENTTRDLGDCVDALERDGLEELSETEREYAKSMYDLCQEYIDAYDECLEA